MPASEPRRFTTAAQDALLEQGWRLLHAPAGLTLATLRAAGAPFKGSRYFDVQAARTQELSVPPGDVAYRPGLMPDSLNHTFVQGERLTRALVALLPGGAEATIAPAALYVWILDEHHRQHGEWPLRQCYTWAADRSRVHSVSSADDDASERPGPLESSAPADTPGGYVHLAVGVFGQQRPLLVSPIPEPSGRGLGVMPIIVPSPLPGRGSVGASGGQSGDLAESHVPHPAMMVRLGQGKASPAALPRRRFGLALPLLRCS